MLQKSKESRLNFNRNNDILTKALGTSEYNGRVRFKGKHYTPQKYFHSMADRAFWDFVK